MNNYQRDLVKIALPGFKTTSYRGKSDRNLRTDHLAPGRTVERRGHTLPTFDDLLRGLQRLPSGLDARGLTQCLSWYINNRDTFTPKLELNVLHTQSLIRALREPLKPFGPQNLDRNALEEWRDKDTFETVEIEEKSHNYKGVASGSNEHRRSQLHLNLDEDDVSMVLDLPVRHILLFPGLAICHGMASAALQMGIQKAENRQAAREGEATKRELEKKWAAGKEDVEEEEHMEVDNPVAALPAVELQQLYRMPKRPLPVEVGSLSAHMKPAIPIGPRNPSAPRLHAPAPPRLLAPAPPRSLAPLPPRPAYTTYTNRRWVAPGVDFAYAPYHQSSANAPSHQSSGYGPLHGSYASLDQQQQQQQMQPAPHPRRVYQDPRTSDPRQNGRPTPFTRPTAGYGEQYVPPSHGYDQYTPRYQYLPRGYEYDQRPLREHEYDQYGNVVRRW
jgi:hypothetical protein